MRISGGGGQQMLTDTSPVTPGMESVDVDLIKHLKPKGFPQGNS